MNAAELNRIRDDAPPPLLAHESVPWRNVLTNRGILVLGSIMVLGSFYTYFFYSWFPKYLKAARGIDDLRAGMLASIVLAGSAVGMLFGGWLADAIPRKTTYPLRAKRYVNSGCYLIAAACLYCGIRCDDPFALAGFWGASFCAMHVTLPIWWSVAIPQCGRHIGALSGLMNGVGVIGAMASQSFAGQFSDWRERQGYAARERWDPMFDYYVGALVLAAVAWWAYRYRPLQRREHPRA